MDSTLWRFVDSCSCGTPCTQINKQRVGGGGSWTGGWGREEERADSVAGVGLWVMWQSVPVAGQNNGPLTQFYRQQLLSHDYTQLLRLWASIIAR